MSLDVLQSARDSSVVVRFDASWLRYVRGPRRDLDQILGDNPRAVFAVDGTMFESHAGSDVLLNFDTITGVNVASRKPTEGMTIAVVNRIADAVYGGALPIGASVAIQTWPSLVRNGRVSASNVGTNVERVWRVGMGVTNTGRIAVVMLVGTMVDLANRMVSEGLVNAGYLDGGSSLAAEARGVFRRVHTAPSGSRVPGWVLAVPPDEAPDATLGTVEASSGGASAAVPVVCAVALTGLFGWILATDG